MLSETAMNSRANEIMEGLVKANIDLVGDAFIVLELTKRLGLTETKRQYPDRNEFNVRKRTTSTEDTFAIVFGAGNGYCGFECEFVFNEDGKLLRHEVWE